MDIVSILTISGVVVGIVVGIVQLFEFLNKRRSSNLIINKVPSAKNIDFPKSYIPNLKNLMVIMAHPDDSEIGCGGLMARLKEQNWTINVVVVSDGSGTEASPSLRQQEQLNGLNQLGISENNTYFLGYPDCAVRPDKNLVSQIRALVDQHKPALIVTHSKHDSHQDHFNVYTAVSGAVRFIPILSCFIPTSTRLAEFSPVLYISYTEWIGKKAAAIAAHNSQITRGTVNVNQIIQTDRLLSAYGGLVLGESFEIQLPPQMSVWPDILTELNDGTLPCFWNRIAGSRSIAVIFPEAPRDRFYIDIETSRNDYIAGTNLVMRLQSLPGYKNRVFVVTCDDDLLQAYYKTHCCIFIAGRIPNPEAKKLYDSIHQRLEYTFRRESRMSVSAIISIRKGMEFAPEIEGDQVIVDYGMITACWSHKEAELPKSFLWAAGNLGYGTFAAAEVLYSTDKLASIISRLDSNCTGFQIIVRIEPKKNMSYVLLDTLVNIDFSYLDCTEISV